LLTESSEDFIGNVGARIGVKRNVRRGDAVVGLHRIEHRKAVVVLGREDDVFHARILRDACPDVGIKADGVKGRR
jgi:hypothetical protein